MEDISKDPELSECANIYFNDRVKVIEHGDYYEFDGDGRHRVIAAEAVGVDIPVQVIGEAEEPLTTEEAPQNFESKSYDDFITDSRIQELLEKQENANDLIEPVQPNAEQTDSYKRPDLQNGEELPKQEESAEDLLPSKQSTGQTEDHNENQLKNGLQNEYDSAENLIQSNEPKQANNGLGQDGEYDRRNDPTQTDNSKDLTEPIENQNLTLDYSGETGKENANDLIEPIQQNNEEPEQNKQMSMMQMF